MEDFCDVKLTEIDGEAVSLFGVFDGMVSKCALFTSAIPFVPWFSFTISGALGHGGSRAAEYLKEHLFENLMKHPEFLTDTKLAISTFALGIFCTFFLSLLRMFMF
jgi:protein phosphatase 1L